MSQLCNIARCKECEKTKYDEAEFCVVIEYLNKKESIKVIEETKCPDCGSDNWYFTDATEH